MSGGCARIGSSGRRGSQTPSMHSLTLKSVLLRYLSAMNRSWNGLNVKASLTACRE
ncbi:MAG: hypothetical protein AVDCRST_MAG62-814 [uncultured Sphingomonas sp.]|uniref:Uncharacterized protein n=1 Tax=uncultured Sphingomonas sp. TaxID=158754 RepID=A0A6J4T7D9_9SPHN|nr:MAG: hypothetical protein AVDCRST_MAG62-814 [uncultured Sphingomonas sp.]